MDPGFGQTPAVVADKYEASDHTGNVMGQNDPPKVVNRFQSVGIDENLIHLRAAGFQGVDQFVRRRTVEVTI